MMVKKKIGWFISVSILFVTAVLCGVFGFGAMAEPQNAIVFGEVQIEKEYKIGDELTIPTIFASKNGRDYECTSILILPDGAAVQKSSIVFDESGNYTIVYKAMVNGEYAEKSVRFTVINDLYSVHDSKSSATWGLNPYFEESISGINLSLKPDDVFTFNQVIDVSKLTKNDYICKFYVTPLEKGKPEASNMYIKLTDIYDAENYVLINYSMRISEMGWSSNYIYANAGANGQDMVGYEWRDATHYTEHRNSWAGLRSWVSYTGESKAPPEVANNPQLVEELSKFENNYDYLTMDYANRTLHAKSQSYWRDYTMIVDLDDPETYGSNCWGGFTTGEVRMSVYFENYVGASANIFITEIAGYDLTRFNFKDDVAPIIEINYDGYTQETLPVAFVGKPYKLFDGRAIDNLDENVQLKTRVYYNYYSNARTQCYIKDGRFTPKRAGTYTVVYSATDVLGNEAVETVNINCVDSENTVKLTIDGEGKTLNIGESVRLNGYSVSDNNGRYTVSVEAVLKNNNNVRNEIDLDTLTFKPTHLGEYEVRYTVSDYTHTFTAIDLVTVNKVNIPILDTYSQFPAYMIKGCQYTFEKATAFDYSGESVVEISADYYVIEDNGTPKKAENNTFIVSASETVEVLCRANNKNGEMSETVAVIPVVDVNYGATLQMANYFQGAGFVPSATEQSITYTRLFDGEAETGLEFINRVLINQFMFTTSFPEDCTNFDTFDLYLTDDDDETNVLKVSFQFGDDKRISFWVNDFTQKVYRVGYVGDTANLNFYYQKSTNSLLINNNLTVKLNETGLFSGFKGGFASFKVMFTGVSGKVGCAVSYVCNQPFNNGIDTVKPVIYVAEKMPNLVEINQEFTIKQAYAFDLLDSAATLTVKLMTNNGNYVSSVDGVVLDGTQNPNRDYTVKLSDYGRYALHYISVDCTGNRYDVQNLITVKDSVGPVITLDKDYRTQGSVGDTIAVAKMQASDNVDDTVTLLCYVIAPDGKMISVDLNGSFTANDKGTYKVYAYAVDKSENVTILSYSVYVA